MKTYPSNQTLKWSFLKRQDYLESSDAIGDGSSGGLSLICKFPIDKIKFDSTKYPNCLKLSQVIEMIDEFYPFGFYPILIDEEDNLKDGQHRLKLAELCGWKFIDVWVKKD